MRAHLGLAYCYTREEDYDRGLNAYSNGFKIAKSPLLREIIIQRMEALAIDMRGGPVPAGLLARR